MQSNRNKTRQDESVLWECTIDEKSIEICLHIYIRKPTEKMNNREIERKNDIHTHTHTSVCDIILKISNRKSVKSYLNLELVQLNVFNTQLWQMSKNVSRNERRTKKRGRELNMLCMPYNCLTLLIFLSKPRHWAKVIFRLCLLY